MGVGRFKKIKVEVEIPNSKYCMGGGACCPFLSHDGGWGVCGLAHPTIMEGAHLYPGGGGRIRRSNACIELEKLSDE